MVYIFFKSKIQFIQLFVLRIGNFLGGNFSCPTSVWKVLEIEIPFLDDETWREMTIKFIDCSKHQYVEYIVTVKWPNNSYKDFFYQLHFFHNFLTFFNDQIMCLWWIRFFLASMIGNIYSSFLINILDTDNCLMYV